MRALFALVRAMWTNLSSVPCPPDPTDRMSLRERADLPPNHPPIDYKVC